MKENFYKRNETSYGTDAEDHWKSIYESQASSRVIFDGKCLIYIKMISYVVRSKKNLKV